MSDASLKIQFEKFGTLDRPWPPPLCFLAERKAAVEEAVCAAGVVVLPYDLARVPCVGVS
jgi:hypothetical protein